MRRDGSRVFHVTEAEAGLTLFAALRLWSPEQTGSETKQFITQQQVQIDGNLCLDTRRSLKPREVVKVLPHAVAAPPSEADIRIHFIDEYLVIIEKPSGITTMRHEEEARWTARRKQRQATLDELLPRVLAKEFDTESRGSRKSRGRVTNPQQVPHQVSFDLRRWRVIPVHRLDRETSGLMVFARTPAAERHLVDQFREHSIARAYRAIVLGDIAEQTIESHLVRDRGDGKRGRTTEPESGQLAVTHVRPLEQLDGYTLIECRLETGRTHQIRIHLSEAGHPLCGDSEYRGPLNQMPQPDRSGTPRLALHATELGIQHPVTGEQLQFQTKLPKDLADFLKRLRSNDRPTDRTQHKPMK
ncbi:MAG: RluA family pseudouridine synthase [Planctomycetia bacterium]|nr:RluA family pseudouridine synthase [Planctomycetia bacterium]